MIVWESICFVMERVEGGGGSRKGDFILIVRENSVEVIISDRRLLIRIWIMG